MTLTVTNTGTAPLVKAAVSPFIRENLATRGSYVRVDNTSNVRQIMSNARLRMNHLLAIGTTSARKYRAATKDQFGIWSEYNSAQQLSFSNFASGVSERSIGSAASSDLEVEEPQVLFPTLMIGSGYAYVQKTISDDGAFYDESRRYVASDPRISFNVELVDLDQETWALMQRWYQSLNGSLRPFYFDFTDPAREDDIIVAEVRYVVRFRDPQLVDQLFQVDQSNLSFTLIEVVGSSVGGAV